MASSRYVTPEDAAPAPLLPDYELLRLIGRGAYGEVWLARGVTGVFRAVKIVWRTRFPDPRPYEREFRGLTEFAAISLIEARQLALLHVSRNDAEGFFYYVMELADDAETGREIDPERYIPRTLREVRSRAGRLPAAESISIGVELARGLAGMHSRNLVHRDIKPSNIIFVGGAPKLADIGLVATASDDLTFVGTEGFVPPEGPGTPAADVYSLGKVLYELVTGLDRREYPRLPPDFDKAPDRSVILELNEVIIRACDPDATRRFKDAQLVLDELLLLQAGRSVRRMRVAERRLARSLQIAALLAVAAGVAGTGAWLEHQRLARETARRVQAEATLEALARQTLYSANLNRAQRGLETGDYSLARRALAELKPAPGDPDTRGFEWKVLWDQIQGDSADVTQIPGRSIDQLFSSADGRLIAGRLDDNRTEIWDADSLKVRSIIEGVPHLVGFTPDGLSLVGTDRSSRFCRWSLRTGEMDAQQSPYLSTERPVAPFGPEGMISMSSDDSEHPRTLRVWDFGLKQDTLVVPVAIEDPKGWDFVIASLSRDQRICAVAMTRYTRPPLYLWRLLAYDMTTGKLAFDRATNSRVTAVALSSTGKFIAYALVDSSEICVDDIASGAQLWKRQVGVGVVRTIRFSPDDRRMAIGGHVSSLLIVDSSDGKPVDAFVGQDSGINETVWNSATGQIFSAGAAGDLRHWHEDGTRKVRTFPGFFSVSFSTQPVCVSDDGRFFAAPTAKNILVWCAIDSLNLLATGLVGQIPLGFDPDSMGLSAVDEKGTLYHYRKDARGKVAAESTISLVTPETGIEDACWSANHKVLVVAGRDGSVNFFNLATGSHRSASGFKRGAIGWANISGDGAMAITGGLDGMVRLWATKSGKATLEWPEATIPFFAAFSPDSSFVAICFQNGEVEIRNLPDGKILKRYKSDLSTLEAVAFLPDGKRLFIGGSNGSVQVLNCQNWQSVITLNDSGGADTGDRTISRLSVSATGNTLMAYRADGRLTAWHYDPSAL